MNDPNGLLHWRDRYHLFYQHNPDAPVPATIHWGHAVSDDLVRWQHLPIALAPAPGGPDADGCWSGDALIHDGVPHLVYTGLRGGTQQTCLAVTSDLDQLVTWEKHAGNPVITGPPAGYGAGGFRDPCVWREGGRFHQLIASDTRGRGAVLLYRSDDLVHWEYLHPFLTAMDDHLGRMWECPDFFPLGDRHVLIVSAIGAATRGPVLWFVGRYVDHHFSPETQGVLDTGDRFYAPQSLADRSGRRIVFGWLREREQELKGEELDGKDRPDWVGWMSLPRELTLGPDHRLVVRPLPELTALRGRQTATADGGRSLGPQTGGPALELDCELEIRDEAPIHLRLRYRDAGQPPVLVTFDPRAGDIGIGGETVPPSTSGRSSPPRAARRCRMQVFLDQGSVEAFSDGAAAAELFHPQDARLDTVEVIGEEAVTAVRSLSAWELRI